MSRQTKSPRYFTSFISGKGERFRYVDAWLDHPDWRGKKVLDFGGNIGNLLDGSPIEYENYWCLDLVRAAMDEGRRRYPDAHWEFYDRYSFQYNPEGRRDLPVPDLGPRFDYIVCFSVFTHTTRREMLATLDQLRPLLAPGGTLLFTFLDHLWRWPERDAMWMRLRMEDNGREYDPDLDVEAMWQQAEKARWCTLVDDVELHCESDSVDSQRPESVMYLTFYRPEYLGSLLPEAEIRPPVPPYVQHACLLKAPAAGGPA
jgi:SAM-dependent methyltransferase